MLALDRAVLTEDPRAALPAVWLGDTAVKDAILYDTSGDRDNLAFGCPHHAHVPRCHVLRIAHGKGDANNDHQLRYFKATATPLDDAAGGASLSAVELRRRFAARRARAAAGGDEGGDELAGAADVVLLGGGEEEEAAEAVGGGAAASLGAQLGAEIEETRALNEAVRERPQDEVRHTHTPLAARPHATWPHATWPDATWPHATWPHATWPDATWPHGHGWQHTRTRSMPRSMPHGARARACTRWSA